MDDWLNTSRVTRTREATVSDQEGQVSEVSGLVPDSAPNVGDVAPDAAASDHVAQGRPRNYSGDRPEQDDPLRATGEDGSASDPTSDGDA